MHLGDDDTWYKAEVLSRAGKATGSTKIALISASKLHLTLQEKQGTLNFKSDVKKWNLITTQ